MGDDLNTAGAIGDQRGSRVESPTRRTCYARPRARCGPGRARGGGVDDAADERGVRATRARKANWAESDRLRDELVAMGYEEGHAQGTVVTKKAAL